MISADVYGVAPHVGRGGWTWYTGSAGWMYRLGIEAILGLQRTGHVLRLDPCIPKQWPGYAMTYRYGRTTYAIQVDNPEGVSRGVRQIMLDGADAPNGVIPLVDDSRFHQVTACSVRVEPTRNRIFWVDVGWLGSDPVPQALDAIRECTR